MRPAWMQSAFAIVVGLAWIAALKPAAAGPLAPEEDDCPACMAVADPSSLHFPALPPATCGVRFFIHGEDGACKREVPEPGAPCIQETGCYFWYTVICQGECGNVVPALFSLGGTALPLWTPCGTDQGLGTLPCGTSIQAQFLVYDVTSGATAIKASNLTCWGCEDDATQF